MAPPRGMEVLEPADIPTCTYPTAISPALGAGGKRGIVKAAVVEG